MSRFAVDPRWLLCLPPTMAPCVDLDASRATSSTRPRRSTTTARPGVDRVVCEEKHMGSRAVVVLPVAEVAPARFGVATAPARSTPAPAGRSSTTTRDRRAAGPGRAARDGGRALGRAGHRLAAARRRAAALVGQGGRADPRAVRRRRRGRRARCRPRSPCWTRPRRAGSTWASCAARIAAPAGERRGVHRRVPALLLADRRAGRVRLAPFQVLAAEGGVPRRPRPRLAPRAGRPAGRRGPGADHADPAAGASTWPTRRPRRRRPTGGWR